MYWHVFSYRSVASALDYLHREKRILHGDMKSGNVLVIGDFKIVKICDFGVALRLDENLVVAEDEVTYMVDDIIHGENQNWAETNISQEGN